MPSSMSRTQPPAQSAWNPSARKRSTTSRANLRRASPLSVRRLTYVPYHKSGSNVSPLRTSLNAERHGSRLLKHGHGTSSISSPRRQKRRIIETRDALWRINHLSARPIRTRDDDRSSQTFRQRDSADSNRIGDEFGKMVTERDRKRDDHECNARGQRNNAHHRRHAAESSL